MPSHSLSNSPIPPTSRSAFSNGSGRHGLTLRSQNIGSSSLFNVNKPLTRTKRVGIMNTRVSDILRNKGHEVVTTSPEATVFECIATMVEHNVGSIVVTEGSDVSGIFTERDYLRRIVLQGRTSKTTRVDEVMTSDVITVTPDHTVEKCMSIMTAHKCRHLPVIDDGTLTGIVSIGDCVKQVSRDAQAEAETLKAYVTGKYPA